MVTHSSVLAWRIPGTGSLVGYCLWGRTDLDTTEAAAAVQIKSKEHQDNSNSISKLEF